MIGPRFRTMAGVGAPWRCTLTPGSSGGHPGDELEVPLSGRRSTDTTFTSCPLEVLCGRRDLFGGQAGFFKNSPCQ